MGIDNVIDIEGDVIGTQRIDTDGGAYIGGGVNTGGGTFIGRDQTITTNTTISQGATLEQFTTLLAQLRDGLDAAGLDTKIQKVIESDLTGVESEASDSNPSRPVIESKLQSMQSLLQNAARTGTAAIGLVEIIQRGMEMAQKLF